MCTWIKNVFGGGDVFGCSSLGEGVVEGGDFHNNYIKKCLLVDLLSCVLLLNSLEWKRDLHIHSENGQEKSGIP